MIKIIFRLAPLLLKFLPLVALLHAFQAQALQVPPSIAPQTIEIYVSQGCPHCEAAKSFISRLAQQRTDLKVIVIEIRGNPQAQKQLEELSRMAGIDHPGVPTVRIGSQLFVGFDSEDTSGRRIRQLLDHPATNGPLELAAECGIATDSTCNTVDQDVVAIPFIGKTISVESVGLPIFTVVIGLLDGFNPCSMWVLILMVSMLASLNNRKKMVAIAGTFVVIEGIAYFAFMAAWLNLFFLIGISRQSEIVIAALAIIAATINFKDFLKLGPGVSLSIPTKVKPSIYARLRAILYAERMLPAILGAAVLAVLVQIVELLCTSGFPALYTRILTLHHLDNATYYVYLLLYNLMYLLDDVIVLGIGVVTLSHHRLQENEGRALKLLAATTMLGLGLYLIFH
jgi:glutaredoxin